MDAFKSCLPFGQPSRGSLQWHNFKSLLLDRDGDTDFCGRGNIFWGGDHFQFLSLYLDRGGTVLHSSSGSPGSASVRYVGRLGSPTTQQHKYSKMEPEPDVPRLKPPHIKADYTEQHHYPCAHLREPRSADEGTSSCRLTLDATMRRTPVETDPKLHNVNMLYDARETPQSARLRSDDPLLAARISCVLDFLKNQATCQDMSVGWPRPLTGFKPPCSRKLHDGAQPVHSVERVRNSDDPMLRVNKSALVPGTVVYGWGRHVDTQNMQRESRSCIILGGFRTRDHVSIPGNELTARPWIKGARVHKPSRAGSHVEEYHGIRLEEPQIVNGKLQILSGNWKSAPISGRSPTLTQEAEYSRPAESQSCFTKHDRWNCILKNDRAAGGCVLGYQAWSVLHDHKREPSLRRPTLKPCCMLAIAVWCIHPGRSSESFPSKDSVGPDHSQDFHSVHVTLAMPTRRNPGVKRSLALPSSSKPSSPTVHLPTASPFSEAARAPSRSLKAALGSVSRPGSGWQDEQGRDSGCADAFSHSSWMVGRMSSRGGYVPVRQDQQEAIENPHIRDMGPLPGQIRISILAYLANLAAPCAAVFRATARESPSRRAFEYFPIDMSTSVFVFLTWLTRVGLDGESEAETTIEASATADRLCMPGSQVYFPGADADADADADARTTNPWPLEILRSRNHARISGGTTRIPLGQRLYGAFGFSTGTGMSLGENGGMLLAAATWDDYGSTGERDVASAYSGRISLQGALDDSSPKANVTVRVESQYLEATSDAQSPSRGQEETVALQKATETIPSGAPAIESDSYSDFVALRGSSGLTPKYDIEIPAVTDDPYPWGLHVHLTSSPEADYAPV
ncbi:unnamed protein product [Diplocarpon coronariae]